MKKIFIIFISLLSFFSFSQEWVEYEHVIKIAEEEPIVTEYEDETMQNIWYRNTKTLYYAYTGKDKVLIISEKIEDFKTDKNNPEISYFDVIYNYKDILKGINNVRLIGANESFVKCFLNKKFKYLKKLDNLHFSSGFINFTDDHVRYAKNFVYYDDSVSPLLYFNLKQPVKNLPRIIRGKLRELPSD